MNRKFKGKDIVITNNGSNTQFRWGQAGWTPYEDESGGTVYYNPKTQEYATGDNPNDPQPYTGKVYITADDIVNVRGGWQVVPQSTGGGSTPQKVSQAEYDSQENVIQQLETQIQNYKNNWTSPQDLADNYTPNSTVNSQE